MKKEAKYSLGLALSGGGAKGFAHLGVLQAMEEAGMKPDIIAGTSAGALVGVLYADGYSPQEALELFQHKDFTDFAAFSIPKGGLFKTDKFYAFLERNIRAKTFEELQIPLRIVATDIEHGISVIFDRGALVPVVVGSCSYPIVFSPTVIDGKHYVDGGLFKNFPVSAIREACKTVIGVNVSPLTMQKYKNSLLHVAERSFHYMSVSNTLAERDLCDLLIESTKVSKYAMFSTEHSREIYRIGYETAKRKLTQWINEQPNFA
ncbi:MAG: patatin-like phospholipase family protein [Prevotella sp.]|jgi:NTE family protein|nr:patatin-like phospholipase family protein [Prevotella sp.]